MLIPVSILNKALRLFGKLASKCIRRVLVGILLFVACTSLQAEIAATPAGPSLHMVESSAGVDNRHLVNGANPRLASSMKGILTDAEQQWLDDHPGLTLSGDVNWPPFEFIDSQGQYVGMVGSVIALIEERLNYKFIIDHRDSWDQTLEGIKSREIDIVSGLAKTPQREEYINFSDPYFSFPIVLVIREGLQFVTDLRELDDERVGVVKGYASYDYLIINHPDLNLQVVDSVEAGLRALSDGELDVFVSNIPSISFLIKKLGISNVRLTSITPYVYDLRVGVSDNHPELVPILNKAIASIPQQQLDEIYKEWLFKDTPVDVDYRIVRRIALVSFIVIAIFWYWNRKLSKEVAERIRSENALRKSQEQLKQATYEAELLARKADEANRAKSIFLANMSHEIRTPMNAVMGYTELLSLSVKDKKQISYLDSIRMGSKALMTLINDILDLSKVEAGKLHIEFRPIAIKPLFDELQKIFFAKIESKDLLFSVELAHDLPDVLLIDETRLRQVLFNLVGNAIKFTHEGSIKVHAWVTPTTSSETVNLMINVEDTGIGIPYDQHERIFKAFEQREGQSTREYGGTGLGLAISKNLIEMMTGTLQLKSEPGVGSCFTIKLDNVAIVDREHSQSSDASLASPAYQFEGIKILVVDDVLMNRQLLIDLLAETSASIKDAEDGEQAVNLASEWLPDIIFMDIRMPVMDGYKAVELLKQKSDTKHIAVVALTASVMSKSDDKIEMAGFDGYLKKPFNSHELYGEITRLLPGKVIETSIQISAPREHKRKRESQPVSFDSSIRKHIRTEFMGPWEVVNGSGDIAAVTQFAEALNEAATKVQLKGLETYSTELRLAAEDFDLDEMQRLLEEFPDRVSG